MYIFIGPYKDYKRFNVEDRLSPWIGTKAAVKADDAVQGLVNAFWNSWQRDRKIVVEIHGSDVWSMDHTLAHIIVPMLEKMRGKSGSPPVVMSDVPKELRARLNKKEPWKTDDKFHERWDWVLGEMIWAFTQIRDDEWEQPFFEKNPIDMDGYRKYQDRILNGTRLFGKYYQCLWT